MIPEDVKQKIEEVSGISSEKQGGMSGDGLTCYEKTEYEIGFLNGAEYGYSLRDIEIEQMGNESLIFEMDLRNAKLEIEQLKKENERLKREVASLKQQMFSLKYAIKAGRYKK